MKSSPEEPKEPESANGSDSELEAAAEQRIDAAENLRLEAKRDGVKDIEREAKIDELESASDLVATAAQDPDAGKTGALAHADYGVQDNTKIVTANVEPAWFQKTMAARRRELEKMMGTSRPPGGVRALTRERTRGNLKTPMGLLDLGNAILIKAGAPKQSTPDTPRWCLHCTGPIDSDMRSVSKFCCSDHRVAFFRSKTKRDADCVTVKDCRVADADLPFHFREQAPEATPPMSAMHAIRSNQIATYMLARKNDLVTDSRGTIR
jgi:hypothetical protein